MYIIFLETGVKVFLGCKQIKPVDNTGNPRKILFKETTTPRSITIFTYADGSSSPCLDIFDLILSTNTSPPCERTSPPCETTSPPCESTSPPCESVRLKVQNTNRKKHTKYYIFHRQLLLQNPLKKYVHVLQDYLAWKEIWVILELMVVLD